MSFYPSFRNTGNVFNDNNIISLDDTTGGGLTTISLDTSKLVEKENPVIKDTLYIKNPNTGVNFQGDLQLSAFNEDLKADLIDNTNDLTSIRYDGSKTILSDDFDLSSCNLLNIQEGHIPQSKITNLETRLEGIDENLSNINNNDTDILNIQTKNQQQDNRMDTSDLTINNHITSYNTYTTQNDLDKTNINLNLVSLQDKNTEQDLNLSNHLNNYNTYTTQNDIDKLTINSSITSIENYNVSQDNQISTTNTNLSNHIDNYNLYVSQNDIDKTNVNLNITSIDNDLNTTNTNLTNHIDNYNIYTSGNDTNLNNINISLTSLINEDTLVKSRVDDLELYESNQISLNNSNLTRLSNLETQQSTNTSNIALKQNIINDITKLNTAYIGNGDVSNSKLSSLNDIRTDITIQSQLDVMKTELDLFDGSNVVNNTNRISTLESEILTKEDVISDTNKIEISNVNLLQDNLNTLTTNITNNDNSISTINTNLNALTNADTIHDTQISNLQAQDIVLQNNIDLKQNIISLSNKLNTTKIFDTSLNDSLNNILDTIDSNINNLNLNKQNNINSGNLLNSQYLDLTTTNLQYVDITAPLKAQLTNITSAINTLQNLTTNDTITTFQDIEDNFDTLETTKLNKSVYDNTIAPEIVNINNAISTLQGLQDGDVVSFNSINTSITNLTNTKHPLIDINNKLNSSLLNRDDNLQFCDVSSSIQNKFNSVDNDIATKNDIIDSNNKLSISNVDLETSALSFVDINNSLQTKLNSLDSQITTLSNTDVSQLTTNTNLQNSINSNSNDISNLQNFQTTQLATNTTLQNSIDNIDLSSKQDVLTNASSVAFVNITSGLQASLDTLQTNIDNLNPETTLDDMFYNYKENMPALSASKTIMDFTINGENYQATQSSYYGMYSGSPAVQTDSWSVQNLFDTDDSSLFRIGYKNNWYNNENDVLIKYDNYQYDNNGNYIGAFSQQDYNTLINYTGEYLEFQNPFYFKPTSLYIKANLSGQQVLKIHLMGSNDNTNYELIETLTTTAILEKTWSLSTTKKYKTFKMIFNKSATYLGITLKQMKFGGIKTGSIQTDNERITTNETNITNNTNNITQLQTDVSNIDLSGIATNANNIITNSNNITTNISDITDLNTKLNTLQTKTEDYGTLNYDDTVNKITHTYDEKNLFIDPLDDNNLLELDLTINSVSNEKNYKQVLTINALEFKSYVNTLKINGNTVEIKHRDGDQNINLSPIAGYSMIQQVFDITRIGNEWYVMSNIELFHNSVSNVIYDITPPVITLTGSATINHEINSTWTEPGFTATDDPGLVDYTSAVIRTGDINPDTSVLGAVYNIYYNVSDNALVPNVAIQKIRTINIVDTTNPVISLTNPTLDLNIGDTYLSSSAGASASDNSNETLTITVDESNVDTSVAGSFTVSFSTQDSTGNSHSINQIVTVLSASLTEQWSNPSTDIFSLIDAYNKCSSNTLTQNLTTVSTGDTYLQGNYEFSCGSIQNSSSYIRNVFDNGSNIYASMVNTHNLNYINHDFGPMRDFPSGDYPYDRYGTGEYTGVQLNNIPYVGSFDGLCFFSHIDTNTNIDYGGEYLEAIFPFYVEISSVNIVSFNTTFTPEVSHLMGSTDGGATYQLIETFNSPITDRTATYSNTTKYNALKYIVSKITTNGYVMAVQNWRLYGKIFT